MRPLELQKFFAGQMATPHAILRKGASFILAAALPPLCPVCREPLAAAGGLCAGCWAKLTLISRPYCERLGTPFAYEAGAGLLSPAAIADPPAYGRARAVAHYDAIAGTLVRALKYGDRLDLAPSLGHWMANAGAELRDGADALVPVPLHWRRSWARRFNQSALLAKAVGHCWAVPVRHDALRRVRATVQQVGLSRAARADNVQGAFQVPHAGRHEVRGLRLVLVDDVLTSGATVDACARALLRAGAAQVDVLVFAQVVQGAASPI